ncbi:MAG: murein hydrolase activator EnvC family protein [Asticcacaulis sp.]
MMSKQSWTIPLARDRGARARLRPARGLGLALILSLCGLPGRAAPPPTPAPQATAPTAETLAQARRSKARQSEAQREAAREVAREVERMRARLIKLAAEHRVSEARAQAERARLAALNARETEITNRLAATRARLARLLSALQLYSRDPPPALYVSPKKATDAVRAAILMRAITPELKRRAKALSGEVSRLQAIRRDAALSSEALFLAESALAEQRTGMAQLIADKNAREAALMAEADRLEAEAIAIALRERGLRGLSGASALNSNRTASTRTMISPVIGQRVHSYGEDIGDGNRSYGLIWRTSPGAQVVAPTEGDVEYAGALPNYGKVIILYVGSGRRLVLTGLDQIFVRPGLSVAAGEPLGRTNNRSSKPQDVYLEVRQGEDTVDPATGFDFSSPE